MKKIFYDAMEWLYNQNENLLAFRSVDTCGNIKDYTRAQFLEDVRKVAAFINRNGMKGSHIAVMGENSYEYISCFFGILYSGSVVVPLGTEDTKEQMAEKLHFADVSFVLTGTDEEDEFDVKEISEVLKNEIPVYSIHQVIEKSFELKDYSVLAEGVEEDDLAALLFTSGTTAKPDAVMLTNREILWTAYKSIEEVSKAPTIEQMPVESYFFTFLFYHVGVFSIFLFHFMNAAILINSSPKQFIRNVQLFKPDRLAVPPVYLELIYGLIEKGDTIENVTGGNLKMIMTGAAKTRKELYDFYIDHGIAMMEWYGLTETVGYGAEAVHREKRENYSVGQSTHSVGMKIIDNEVCFKAPFVMSGYYHNEEKTRQVLKDGWFHTGDLGYLDENGELFITGRKKNLLILSNGENVGAEEIEERMLSCEFVKEVVAFEKNDAICVEIYPASSENAKSQIEQFVKDYNKNAIGAKKVQHVFFRDTEFPKTGTEKIVRKGR